MSNEITKGQAHNLQVKALNRVVHNLHHDDQMMIDLERPYDWEGAADREEQAQKAYNARLRANHAKVESLKGQTGVDCWNRITDESSLSPEVLAVLQDDPDAEDTSVKNEWYAMGEGMAVSGVEQEQAAIVLSYNAAARQKCYHMPAEYDASGKRINSRWSHDQYVKASNVNRNNVERELCPEWFGSNTKRYAQTRIMREAKVAVRKDLIERGIYIA